MFEYEINQQRLKGGQKMPDKVIKKVLKVAGQQLHLKRVYQLSIAFVARNEIKKLNSAYRGVNKPTDVLSFVLDKDSGEILINYDQAKVQAKEYHHSVRDEVVFLMVHGLLHLFGYDHEKEKEAEKMFKLQTEILNKLDIDSRI